MSWMPETQPMPLDRILDLGTGRWLIQPFQGMERADAEEWITVCCTEDDQRYDDADGYAIADGADAIMSRYEDGGDRITFNCSGDDWLDPSSAVAECSVTVSSPIDWEKGNPGDYRGYRQRF